MKIGVFYDAKNMCYGTLNFFASQVEAVLKRYGVETEQIERMNSSIVPKHFDAFIGFNSPLTALQMDDGTYIMDFFQCPFFNILVDPPYYHNTALSPHMENLYCIFLDEEHVEYCKQNYLPCKSVEMGYLIGPIGDVIPYEERKIDVLFTGGLYNSEEIKGAFYKESGNKAAIELFQYLIECGLEYPEYSTVELMKHWLKERSCEVDAETLNMLLGMVGVKAEYYLRGYYREKVVTALVEAGVKVHVAGGGWERLSVKEEYRDNLVHMGSLDMKQTGEVTANSKILLNVMPWFKNGLHDRIPTAMHNGVVCVTDSSTYIDANFQDMENIVLYNLKEIEKLPDKVKWLLNNPDEAKKIADAGQQKAAAEYTWDKFVLDHILKWLW